jgi:phosphopantothenoylcysteine decarboxylase/phosphopantothenate--cysteine ligase
VSLSGGAARSAEFGGASAGRRILLGVCGGVAAYRAADLVRRLRERGHEVRCAMTPAAGNFVSRLTLEVLSGFPVYGEEYLAPGGEGEELHIAAAAWADLICIAPATANTLAQLAHGLSPNFLTTTVLASRKPLVVAPAMHPAMWEKEATQDCVDRLVARGAVRVGPVEGPLASGEVGLGRLADVAEIVRAVEEALGEGAVARGRALAGHTVLVTAGPTHEPIDPVRFLGNRSSGKMGFAIAAEAARRGARTVLVAGPVALPTPAGVERHDVETALEMEAVVRREAPSADLVIMSAAVADFRPHRYADRKIKRHEGTPEIELVPNPDILASLPEIAPAALRVGFAAETELSDVEAQRKLATKRADLLVANDVSRGDIGFGAEENEVVVHAPDAEPVRISRRPKIAVAVALLDLIQQRFESGEREAANAAR